MISRQYNLLKGLLKLGNYKNIASTEYTYCKLFTTKSQLEDVNEEFVVQENSTSKRPTVKKLPFHDTNLSKIMLQVKSKKLRKRSNLIYFEGKRLLCDALKCGITPLQVYFTKTKDISDIEFPKDVQLIKIPYNDLKIWSDLTTCPGILTICSRPPIIENSEKTIPVSVVCDNIREPGNLGAIIRNCSGAGVEEVYLTEGCVDLWDPKVIRGGMGSHFRIPVHEDVTWGNLQEFINRNTIFIIATNENASIKDDIVPYYKIKYSDYDHITLLVGGETEGISNEALSISKQFINCKVTIPLSQSVESLNSVSALSVILFDIKRQIENNNV